MREQVEFNPEHRSVSFDGGKSHLSAEQVYQLFGDAQAQATAFVCARGARVDLMKGGENIGLQVCGDADPVVGNLDPRSIADPRQANFNHIPGGSEFGGIGDKIVQDLRQLCDDVIAL